MRYIDCPLGGFIDRYKKTLEDPIDVLMLTLDAVTFLERCLHSVYKEIPVRRLLVCDGGSKDGTIETLEKYPRAKVFIRPDIRTTGKAFEFLFSHVETEWFVLIDADIELSPGWYDNMRKYETQYDFFGCRRVLAYHLYRHDPASTDSNARPRDFCHFGRREAVEKYKCDDDYVWRIVDYYLRQEVEKFGYKWGNIPTVYHIHHETERTPYKSDEEKKYSNVTFQFKGPKRIIIDKEKWESVLRNQAKGIVKYLDPEHPLIRRNRGFDELIRMLDKDWIMRNGPKWIKRYYSVNAYFARILRRIIPRGKIRDILSSLYKKQR